MPLEPFLGMITYMAGSYAPKGWATCDGQLLPVNQNQALYALLGTQFGGDGVTTFGLPDLRGRAIMGTAAGAPLGAKTGVENYPLQLNEMPAHSHGLAVSSSGGTTATPANGLALGRSSGQDSEGNSFAVNMYAPALTPVGQASQQSVGGGGGGQPHENRQPYNVLLACIALQGIFPSRQ